MEKFDLSKAAVGGVAIDNKRLFSKVLLLLSFPADVVDIYEEGSAGAGSSDYVVIKALLAGVNVVNVFTSHDDKGCNSLLLRPLLEFKPVLTAVEG